MRYAKIKQVEIENGKGVGTSLFVQGCPIHCKGCHNQETWDFSGGEEWTREVEDEWFKHISNCYVERVSILGGEPLAPQNIDDVYDLILKIKMKFPDKKIWLYTGYRDYKVPTKFVNVCDYIVPEPYIEELHDISLPFMGSRNQRIIDCEKYRTK